MRVPSMARTIGTVFEIGSACDIAKKASKIWSNGCLVTSQRLVLPSTWSWCKQATIVPLLYAESDFTRQDHSSIQDSLEGLKDSISGTKEDLEDQLAQVQRTINTAEALLREVLQDDQARLQSCLNSLTQAQKIADGIHPSIVVQRNRADQGSRAIFGTDTSQPQFSLTVSDNEAQPHAVMGSGVYTPDTPSLAGRLSDGRSRTRSSSITDSNTKHRRKCFAVNRKSIICWTQQGNLLESKSSSKSNGLRPHEHGRGLLTASECS